MPCSSKAVCTGVGSGTLSTTGVFTFCIATTSGRGSSVGTPPYQPIPSSGSPLTSTLRFSSTRTSLPDGGGGSFRRATAASASVFPASVTAATVSV